MYSCKFNKIPVWKLFSTSSPSILKMCEKFYAKSAKSLKFSNKPNIFHESSAAFRFRFKYKFNLIVREKTKTFYPNSEMSNLKVTSIIYDTCVYSNIRVDINRSQLEQNGSNKTFANVHIVVAIGFRWAIKSFFN